MTVTVLTKKNIFNFISGILLLIFMIVIFFWTTAGYRESIKFGSIPSQGGRYIKSADGIAFVLEKGSPDSFPVVLTHGTAAWSGLWLPTMEILANNQYQAIGYDMPPFGYSQHDKDGNYSRQQQALRFLALLRTFKKKPIVVAHSFSGGMVAEAAMIDSAPFAGIVFVDAAIGLNSHIEPSTVPFVLTNGIIREAAAALTTSNPYLTRTLLRKLIHIKSGATTSAIATLQQPMARVGYTKAVSDWIPQLLQSPKNAKSTHENNWRKLDLPINFIWGDRDTITPLNQAKALNALVPNSALNVLVGVGHIPQIEAPKYFQSQLIKTLNALKIKAELRR